MRRISLRTLVRGVLASIGFNVPQQLGAGSVTISPGYLQLYLGLGVSFGWIRTGGLREAAPGCD